MRLGRESCLLVRSLYEVFDYAMGYALATMIGEHYTMSSVELILPYEASTDLMSIIDLNESLTTRYKSMPIASLDLIHS